MEKNNARRYIYRCLRGDRSSGYVVVECLDPVYHGLDDYQLLAGGRLDGIDTPIVWGTLASLSWVTGM